MQYKEKTLAFQEKKIYISKFFVLIYFINCLFVESPAIVYAVHRLIG